MSTKKFKFGKTATIKEYGNDGKKMSKIGVVVDGDDMSTASIFGDKQDWLTELHEKHGGEIEATVYSSRDDLFKADLGPTQYGACYDGKYSEWTIKLPKGSGGGATFRKNYGGGGWQGGGGGFKSSWKPEYRGKPMPEEQFVDFCGRLILHAYKAAHKASPKASEDKLIEVAQSMFATMLIGMQKGMSFPTGYEPAPEATSGGDAAPAAATGLDKSNPTVAAYIENITEAKDQDECITIATEVNSDTSLTDTQKQALKAECLRKQKAISTGVPF